MPFPLLMSIGNNSVYYIPYRFTISCMLLSCQSKAICFLYTSQKIVYSNNSPDNFKNQNHISERTILWKKKTFILDIKVAIHIGFLNFTLFPHAPEFHAIYKMQNVKNHNIYTEKFMLHVIESNSIKLATEEDHNYEIDKWASLFKAKTWEDIHMLVNDNPT